VSLSLIIKLGCLYLAQHDELDFAGKLVLVVGGSSGIGNGIARAFLSHGATVHVWGTKKSRNDYVGMEGSDLTDIEYANVDVSDSNALDAVHPVFDVLDVLVLCQGTVVYKRGEFEKEGWDRVINVNLSSLMACACKLKADLVRARGSLIIVSSVSAFHANRGNPAYAASKAGAVSLTKTLGEAWAAEGVRVNGIAPGLVDTKLTKVTTTNPSRLSNVVSAIPAGRIGTAADMAGAALFLASPLAAYVIGQTLVVDGGWTLS